MEEKNTWWQKYKWVALWGGLILLLRILIVIDGSNDSSTSVSATPNTDGKQTQVFESMPQASSSKENALQVSDKSIPEDSGSPVLIRKTMTDVVRMSTISFNKEMNINQQIIIFGGDENFEDGTGWYCIINGDKNFIGAVAGDTMTATGEAVRGTKSLTNCRVDSLK